MCGATAAPTNEMLNYTSAPLITPSARRTAMYIFNAAASVGDGLATQHLSGLLCFPCVFFPSPPPPAATGQITISSCRTHPSDITPPLVPPLPSLRVLLTMTLNLMPIKGWIKRQSQILSC